MRPNEALAALAPLIAIYPNSWPKSTQTAYSEALSSLTSPVDLAEAVTEVIRTWGQDRRPPVATVFDAYKMVRSRRLAEQERLSAERGLRTPERERVSPERGRAIAEAACRDELRRADRDDAYVESYIARVFRRMIAEVGSPVPPPLRVVPSGGSQPAGS